MNSSLDSGETCGVKAVAQKCMSSLRVTASVTVEQDHRGVRSVAGVHLAAQIVGGSLVSTRSQHLRQTTGSAPSAFIGACA